MVEPLREMSGMRLISIRLMKVELLSYLRALEKGLMRYCDIWRQQSASSLQHSPRSAYRELQNRPVFMDEESEQDSFTDLDHPIPNSIYRVLGKQPLYASTEFLGRCRDFTPDEEE